MIFRLEHFSNTPGPGCRLHWLVGANIELYVNRLGLYRVVAYKTAAFKTGHKVFFITASHFLAM